MKIIYLHGLGSSGHAYKAQALSQAVVVGDHSVEFIAPHLSFEPCQAIKTIAKLINPWDELVLIGSSLGGFYAQYFAAQYSQCKAVLINPLINFEGVACRLYGEHTHPHTGDNVQISDRFVRELEKYLVPEVHNLERFLLLLQTDDDVLDYQQALHKFSGAAAIICTGGGHLFSGFERVIPNILKFIGKNK